MMEVRSFNIHRKYRIRHKEIQKLVRLVLTDERKRRVTINVVFVDDKKMTDLNGTYLNRWYRTDVLSFPLEEKNARSLEGEVYVNLDQAYRQSKEYHVTFASEKARLVVHGVLHLVGFSDATEKLRSRMALLEDRYLLKFGLLRSRK